MTAVGTSDLLYHGSGVLDESEQEAIVIENDLNQYECEGECEDEDECECE